MNLEQHLKRQLAFSRATFGPGHRQRGIIEHIRKELEEISRERPASIASANEWVDVVILALDGLTRAISTSGAVSTHEIASTAVEMLEHKQTINEFRDWPDWRGATSDKPIEHIRPKLPQGATNSKYSKKETQ